MHRKECARRPDRDLPPARRVELQDQVTQHSSRRGNRIVARVVVDGEETARLHVARKCGDRLFGRRRVLDDPEAQHHVERVRRNRQRSNVRLTDEVVLRVTAVRVVRLHRGRKIRGDHSRPGLEQNLREPARSASGLEHGLPTHDVQ